jgi:hypothetical protein
MKLSLSTGKINPKASSEEPWGCKSYAGINRGMSGNDKLSLEEGDVFSRK